MESVKAIAKGFLMVGVAAASLAFAGCGPDYAIFRVHVASATPRDDILVCLMTVRDTTESADKNVVLKDYPLAATYGKDSEGNLTVKSGCGDRLTPADVGIFSYSTSRSSGALTFTVDAYTDLVNHNSDTLVESATSDAKQVQKFPPEIPVEVGMARLPGK